MQNINHSMNFDDVQNLAVRILIQVKQDSIFAKFLVILRGLGWILS